MIYVPLPGAPSRLVSCQGQGFTEYGFRVRVRATVEVRLRDLSYRRSRDLAKMRADLCNVLKNLVY